jgi:hypothetical protein
LIKQWWVALKSIGSSSGGSVKREPGNALEGSRETKRRSRNGGILGVSQRPDEQYDVVDGDDSSGALSESVDLENFLSASSANSNKRKSGNCILRSLAAPSASSKKGGDKELTQRSCRSSCKQPAHRGPDVHGKAADLGRSDHDDAHVMDAGKQDEGVKMPSRCTKIATFMFKGGVGKTTTTVHIASALAGARRLHIINDSGERDLEIRCVQSEERCKVS